MQAMSKNPREELNLMVGSRARLREREWGLGKVSWLPCNNVEARVSLLLDLSQSGL